MEQRKISYDSLVTILRNIKDEKTLSLLFLSACENEEFDVCQACLDAGANINSQKLGIYYETLLIKLIENGTFTSKIADWLISKGADVDVGDIRGITPLGIACSKGNFEIVKYFINKGAKISKLKEGKRESDLRLATEFGKNYDIVKLLLDSGADVEEESRYEENPFVGAVNSRKPEIVELFLQKGVSPNSYFYGKTPLHMAVLNEDTKTVRILLESGVNVKARMKTKEMSIIYYNAALTAMDIAIAKGNAEMQKLLKFGAESSSKEEKISVLLEFNNNEADRLMKSLLKS